MFNPDGSVNINGGSEEMVLYFTSDRSATVTVSIPGTGWTRSYSVTANQVTTSDIIPKSGLNDARILSEGKSNKGIHITSNEPIIAYAHIYDGAISGASLLFPTTILTNEYYSINFKQNSNDPNSYSYCYVVAVEDNTTIEVIPSVTTINYQAGDTITVTLNKGEVFNLFGKLLPPVQVGTNNFGQPIYLYRGEDLTGTKIRSIAGNNATCRKIAVFSGSGKINIQCAANVSETSDNYMQQVFPPNAWGLKYITAPTAKMPVNYFRVCVSDPSTVVKRNGVILTGLINNFFYEYQSSSPDYIEASKPVVVSQYITSRTQCGNPNIPYTFNGQPESLGDPEMIYLSPIEQTIEKVTVNSTPNAAIREHYINILIKNSGVSSLKIDGAAPAVSGNPHPNLVGYRYYQVPLTQGAHTVRSDSGFNAIAYGYGNAESYGYNAGTNVKDLYQFITIRNQYGKEKTKEACTGTPFIVSLTLPYLPLSIQWKLPGYPDYTQSGSITPDSTYSINGKTVFVFKLPNAVVYNSTGIYFIDILVNNPTSSGCTGEQTISYELVVSHPPVVNFTWNTSGCIDSLTEFTAINNANGKNITGHYWDFGDSTYSNLMNPAKIYTKPGTYKVRYAVITDGGCISDTVEKTVTVTKIPVAKFTVSNPACVNRSIVLTDSSFIDGANGLIGSWAWNTGIGLPIVKPNNQPVTLSFSDTGVYNISLQVISNSGCHSLLYNIPINVSPNPVADFTFSDACLPNTAVKFTNLSSVPGGSPASLSCQWNFGDPNSGPGNNSSLFQPVHSYNGPGTFSVQLKSTSSTGCKDSVTKLVNTIYLQPKAGMKKIVDACVNTPLFFVDSSITLGQSAGKWNWQFYNPLGTPIASSVSKDTSLTFTAPGIYTVKHWIESDKNCISDTLSSVFTVHPKPVSGFISNSILCQNNQLLFVDTSKISTGSITRRFWDMGDGTILDGQNFQPVSHTYKSWGPKTIHQFTESDKGCRSDTVSKLIAIHPLPQAGFTMPEVCINDMPVFFTNTSNIADGSIQQLNYNWNFNAGQSPVTPPPSPAISNTVNPGIQFNAPGTYSISLTVTSNNGCKDSVTYIPFTVNGANITPSFKLLESDKICSGQEINLRHQSTVDAGKITRLEIIWDDQNNPSVIETDELPVHSKIYNHKYPLVQGQSPVTYRIRYRVFSGVLCRAEITENIQFHPYPRVQFLPVAGICYADSNYLITQASELTGASGKGIYSGAGIDSSGIFNPARAGAGKHRIRYTFTNSAGCSAFAEQTIEVWAKPVVNFNIQSPLCEKNNLQLIANASTQINTWKWNFGDNTPDTIIKNRTVTHVYNSSSLYKITLIAVDANGCKSTSAEKQISIHPLPKPDFRLPKICLPGGRAEFINLSTIADGSHSFFKYNWNFGVPFNNNPSGNEQHVKDPVYHYGSAGPFTVQLTVTSNNGCTDSVTKIVSDVFPQPQAQFSVKDSACVNEQLSFKDMSTAPASSVSEWHWHFGNGMISSASSPSYTFNKQGDHVVSLIVQNKEGCLSDTTRKSISIWEYPVINAGQDFMMLENESKPLSSVTAAGSALRYWWSPPYFLSARASKHPVINNPQHDITYTLEVTGRAGCKSFDDINVKVLKLPKPPNTFTPNGDGVNDFWEINYLNQYPGCILEIYNTAGSLLYRSVGYASPWNGKWKGEDLPAGTYYYVIDLKYNGIRQKGYVTILK
ncbi:MAG: PKD domain-containing protein [Chitinophagaceae bacterium]|nr:PKD domain-containing protein [Chitinophagaceae bacterium]